MALEFFNTTGINTYINPIVTDGQLIHSVNMVSFPYGAKSKRPGYNAFLGTPDNSQVQNLFSFPRNDGTTVYVYRASGTQLYFSTQGTGAWTACAGYSTIGSGNHFDPAVITDTGANSDMLVGGDGAGTTRYTTDGTTFNSSGSLVPVGYLYHTMFQNRIYATGNGGTVVYSSANSGTNWSGAAPFDSSSFIAPGEGAAAKSFNTADRIFITKNRGRMFHWDGNSLVDMASKFGPSSPWSIAEIEDYRFFINQYGHFGFDGVNVQLLSNPVQRYFYNRANTGIDSSQWSKIPAICHFYDYFASIGTVQDDFTRRGINNAILNYNYQKNEYLMWQFADFPTAWHSYNDATNKRQLIFGNSSGQCFQLDPTATTDNGAVINTELVFAFIYAASSTSFTPTSESSISASSYDKKWNWLRLFFNPGCEANIQFAVSNDFTYDHLTWQHIVDPTPNTMNIGGDGIVEFRFPQGTRGRILFLRIYEASPNSQWTYYGAQIDAQPQAIL